MALEFRVTDKLMKELEDYYKNGKPKLILSFNSKTEDEWTILTFENTPENIDAPLARNLSESSSNLKELKTKKRLLRANSVKVKNPSVSFQNIINNFKIDLSDTLKNIFTRKESKQEIANEQDISINTKASFIQEETNEIKSKMEQRKPSFVMGYQNYSEKTETITTQDTFRGSARDSYLNPVHQTELQIPKVQTGRFEIFKDHFAPVEDMKPTLNFGYSKVRPQNISLDASDPMAFASEKSFIKQMNLSSTNKTSENLRNSFGPTANFHFQDDLKSIYHAKSKCEDDFRKQSFISYQADDKSPFTANRTIKRPANNISDSRNMSSLKASTDTKNDFTLQNFERLRQQYASDNNFKKYNV